MKTIITLALLTLLSFSAFSQAQVRFPSVRPCFIKLSQVQYINANRIISSKLVKSNLSDEYLMIQFTLDGAVEEKVNITLEKDEAERFMDDFFTTYNKLCK